MTPFSHWQREPGARLQGTRALDLLKVQAPGVLRTPEGRYRLYYTAIGPERPFRSCQGSIFSAVSDDGLLFRPEPGIRIAPRPDLPHMSLRVLAPTVIDCEDGRWRMYFEARGAADRPTVICSAISSNMVDWEHEEGIRVQGFDGVGGPRYVPLTGRGGRLYCCRAARRTDDERGEHTSRSVISATTDDGLHFEIEPGVRMADRQTRYDSAGITAADVIPPGTAGGTWYMLFSAWQDVPPGTAVPPHPSQDVEAVASGRSEDFAAASIAADMAGYRSRIFVAYSADGLQWRRGPCVIEGAGYEKAGIDAVHAEDMSVIRIGEGIHRLYYAACDSHGAWRIASARSV